MLPEVTATARTRSGAPARRRRDNPEAYIPGDRRRALGAGAEMPDRVRGSAIFADISGFTSLTEALARELGPLRGAEELTAALETVFDGVLHHLHRHGGSVIYFSGDAVTCWLDGDDGVLGVSCALAMQAAMSEVGRITTPGGAEVELGMKVAVAAGPARRFVVGDPAIQLIDVLGGALMDRLAGAEHLAQRGEVVVDGQTLHHLEGRVGLSEVRGEGGTSVGVVTALFGKRPVLPVAKPYPRLPRATVRQWLLPAVYQRMRSGHGEFLSELRHAVPLFVRFGGFDFDVDEDAPQDLDTFIQRAQRLIDRHGGNVLQLTIGDKGAYLYAVFGSPLAHEDDAARACAAALELLGLEADTKATGLQIGIAAGRLRSGTYGHYQRRTFCCLGDAVNLSARLMGAAPPGQIYVTPDVARAAATRFELEELPALSVKGKTAPIAVRRLLAPHGHHRPRQLRALHPLVGRQHELDRLLALADDALGGRGRLVGISAEAGMGKSSLTAVLAETLEARGVPVIVGAAASVGSATSYLAWQPVWRVLLGLSADHSETPEELVGVLEAALHDVDPALLSRLPLLGEVLGAPIVDNEVTASFDAKLRKNSLESLLAQLLGARAATAPVAIVIEDGHWLDPLSVDLLDVLARNAATLPLFLLVTYRPGSFEPPTLDHATVFALDRLDEPSCRAVLGSRLRDLYGPDCVPAGPLVDRLVARAEGNPFYLGELASYLHDRQADPADPAAAAIELPASLSSLVLSRIDTLGERARRTLKVASVVGRDFDVRMLAGAYPTLGGTRQVLGQLRALAAEDLVIAEDVANNRYAFRHAVIQEVAYESLPLALRATVHGRVGSWLEETDPGALDLLAHHFWHSRAEHKKREYLRKAGDAAKARFANDAAIDYFRRLAPLVDDTDREGLLNQLAEVLEVHGAWSEAVDVHRQVLELATARGDGGAVGRAHMAISEQMWFQGHYDRSLAETEAAERQFDRVGDTAGLAWVESARGVVAALQGDFESGSEHLRRSLELHRSLGDQTMVASVLTNLGMTALSGGDYDAAWELTEQSLAIYAEAADLPKMSMPRTNLGLVAYLKKDYRAATVQLEEALRIATEIGSSWTMAFARQHLGNCARELGQLAVAREHYAYALDVFTAVGDRYTLCLLMQDIAMAAAAHHPEMALRLIGATDAMHAELGTARMNYESEQIDQHLRTPRELLGDMAAREQAAGQALGSEEAVALCRDICGAFG